MPILIYLHLQGLGYSVTFVDGQYCCIFSVNFAMMCGDGPTAREMLAQSAAMRTLVGLGDRQVAEMATARADAVDAAVGSPEHALREDAAPNQTNLVSETHAQPSQSDNGNEPTTITCRSTASRKRRIPIPAILDERMLFSDVVKTALPSSSAMNLKDMTRLAYAAFLALVSIDEQRSTSSVILEMKDASFGLKARLPEKWIDLAKAAVQSILCPSEVVLAAPDADRTPSDDREHSCKKRRPFIAEDEHATAKDMANIKWIQTLKRGGKIFFLDSWSDITGLRLRTTTALLQAGHHAVNLFSANPDDAIVSQLRRNGVTTQHGTWAESSFRKYDGIYLDLCSGSAGYLQSQLEIATLRSNEGCMLAWTLTERDFNGEPLLLRAYGLIDFLKSLGWAPAMKEHKPSALLHRSGTSKQQVLTEIWLKL